MNVFSSIMNIMPQGSRLSYCWAEAKRFYIPTGMVSLGFIRLIQHVAEFWCAHLVLHSERTQEQQEIQYVIYYAEQAIARDA